MVTTIEALFDGTAFYPAETLTLEPNTRVRITVETLLPPSEQQLSFLQTSLSLNLEGPPDWSSNLDSYLYGEPTDHES